MDFNCIKIDRYVSDLNSWDFKWLFALPEHVMMNKRNIGCVYQPRRFAPKFKVSWIYKVKLKGLTVTQWKWIIFQKVNK